jgi:imidazolonepropionase
MNNKQWDSLWVNAQLVTLEGDVPYGFKSHAALAVKEGKIAWIGDMNELPGEADHLAHEVVDAKNKCITPGLVDCHTHLVFGGNRAREFEMRLQGVSYEEIARAGGGIRSTVAATRAASEDELFLQSIQRARALLAGGVTTIEIKSGYGLDLETELKILRVAKRIQENLPITVVSTFLGAHALPAEFQNRADDYIDHVCNDMIPAVSREKLASAVDVFCETIGFTLAQTERVFAAAKKAGLDVKCHAEQLSDMGGAELAAKYQALSADHLEFLSEQGVEALAKSGTVAVLLPGAFYFLREKKFPPIELLRDKNVPMAIATDCNPGTSPVTSLLLMVNMACTLFRLTPEEALLGVTRHAAQALGLSKTHGSLTIGKIADFVLWNVSHPVELAYYVGWNRCFKVVKNGKGIDNNHHH